MGTEDVVAETLDRAARRRRVQQGLIGLSLFLVLSVLAWAALEVRATSAYLKECTTPSTETETHPCYEEGQQRTEEAITILVNNQRYNAFLMVCILTLLPEERNEAAVEGCEAESLKQVEGTDTASFP